MSSIESKNIVGFEFVCKNEKCSYFKTGFTMYMEWPITHIDNIINSNIPQDLKDHLIKSKNEGRKYALITLPNKDNIEIIGKRVQLFCPKDCIIWEREIVDKNDIIDVYCDKCREKLITAREARENGIVCPSCKEKLDCMAWFSNG